MPEIVDAVNEEFDATLKQMENGKDELDKFSAQMAEKGYSFKTPCQLHLKPYFIDEERLSYIRHSTEILGRALGKILHLYQTSPETLPLLSLSEAERELISIPCGYQNCMQFCRYDAFLGEDYLQYFKCDTDSPIGSIFMDTHGELIEDTHVFQELGKKYGLSRDPVLPHFLRTILVTYDEFGERRQEPRIAITGPANCISPTDFSNIVQYFRTLGYEVVFCDFSQWQYDGEYLRANDGEPVDIVYRYGPLRDWVDGIENLKPLLDALKNKHVCMVNPFSSALASHKAFFALLQQRELESIFDSEELKFIQETIPWTRFLQEGTTTNRDGKEVDLLAYVRENRSELVIKSCDVDERKAMIGLYATEDEWNECVQNAGEGKYIVQSYVSIPEQNFPVYDPDLDFVGKKVAISFFSNGGLYSGAVSRIADSYMLIKEASMASVFIVTELSEEIVTVRMPKEDI